MPLFSFAKQFAKRALARRGLGVYPLNAIEALTREANQPPNPIRLCDMDATFNGFFKQIAGHTLVDINRCFMYYQFCLHAANLPGDIAEVGVYQGGTAKLLTLTLASAKKEIHLFDTFMGMPEVNPDKDNAHHAGDFAETSLEGVQRFIGERANIHFHQGHFPGTAGPIMENQFAFVHIDVDIYQSVVDCCAFFYPRMVKGGIMLFDDYGFVSCEGAKAGVDEFFADRPERACYLQTGQCFAVKM